MHPFAVPSMWPCVCVYWPQGLVFASACLGAQARCFCIDLAVWTGPILSDLPEHMWCMQKGVATAGCAVLKWKDRIIVESNTYGNKTFASADYFNPSVCEADPSGCVLWKQSPPSLLDSLIKMFMELGTVKVENQLIAGQGGLQAFLILLAFISVPLLLLPKPLILKRRHEAKQKFATLDQAQATVVRTTVAWA